MGSTRDSVALVGVDLGTSSVRARLYSRDLRLLREAKAPLDIHSVAEKNVYEQDANDVYLALRSVLKAVLRDGAITSAYVGLCSYSPSLLALDREGRPISKVFLWLDRRAWREAEEIRAEFGGELYRRTGLRPDPIFHPSRILWIRRRMPDVFRRAEFFVQIKDYVLFRLTGEILTDYSSASETQLLNLSGRWDGELLGYLGIDEHNLPQPVASAKLLPVKQRLLKLDGEIYVAVGGVDSACSSLGVGVLDEGPVAATIGTSLCLDAALDRPVLDREERYEVYRHVVPDRWLIEASHPTAGASIDKILELIGGRGLHEVASASPPGARGLIVLPFLAGSRSPDWNPRLRGVIYGLSLESGREDLVRAFMEGLALWVREVYEDWKDLGVAFEEIRACGGASRSSTLIKTISNVLQIRALVPQEVEASSLGAALIAGVGGGIYSGFREAASIVRFSRQIDPDPATFPIYEKIYRKYILLRRMVKDLEV